MKSPAELAARFRRQWFVADNRESRLLDSGAWPISLPIVKPTAQEFTNQTGRVREHIQQWRAVETGEVIYDEVNYRAGAGTVEVPVYWKLNTAAEWIAAIDDPDMELEYEQLQVLLREIAPEFRVAVIRQRNVICGKNVEEILRAAALASCLEPGCAAGRPLRALAMGGADTKFFERHRGVMIELLDVRFEGEVSELGLELFLGALPEGDHWVLVVPLQPGVLPFAQQRVRSAELETVPLNFSNVLIVENERSLHQLPLMLARARVHQPTVTALVMSAEIFDEYSDALAVSEPVVASASVPEALTPREGELYVRLRGAVRGRIEQELLPATVVITAIERWLHSAGAG